MVAMVILVAAIVGTIANLGYFFGRMSAQAVSIIAGLTALACMIAGWEWHAIAWIFVAGTYVCLAKERQRAQR